eukprot:6422015-Prymnesium_polylepis.3
MELIRTHRGRYRSPQVRFAPSVIAHTFRGETSLRAVTCVCPKRHAVCVTTPSHSTITQHAPRPRGSV